MSRLSPFAPIPFALCLMLVLSACDDDVRSSRATVMIRPCMTGVDSFQVHMTLMQAGMTVSDLCNCPVGPEPCFVQDLAHDSIQMVVRRKDLEEALWEDLYESSFRHNSDTTININPDDPPMP